MNNTTNASDTGKQQIEKLKEASTSNSVADLIKKRYSGRSFADFIIPEEEVRSIIEAAAWAPSSMNEQPWLFRVADRGSNEFNEIFECLLSGNQPWAKNASLLIVTLIRNNHASTGKPNTYAMHDAGLANAQLILQATSLGYTTHLMGGFDREKLSKLFTHLSDISVVTVTAIGKQDDADKLPEPFRTRELTPRSRKSLTDLLI